jgi:hypothetical protein
MATGLDELRVSLDALEPRAFLAVRGKDMTQDRSQCAGLHCLQRPKGSASIGLTVADGLKETIDQLPAFVRLAHQIGVGKSICKISCSPARPGLGARPSALFENWRATSQSGLRRRPLAEARGFLQRLRRHRAGRAQTRGRRQPWSLCRGLGFDEISRLTEAIRAASRHFRCAVMMVHIGRRDAAGLRRSGTDRATKTSAAHC